MLYVRTGDAFRRLYTSNPTLVLVRPNLRILAKRRSNSFTRSPYIAPGSIRFTLIFGALFESGRPSVKAASAVGTAYSARRGWPWSLRDVPAICTSTLGTVYEPRPVYRVMKPVDELHQALPG